MRERSTTRERHNFSRAAAMLLLGAGALTACNATVEGTPVQHHEAAIEAPAQALDSPRLNGVDLQDILAPTEAAPQSPKNDTSRCVFAASQAALTKFMHDPTARFEHQSPTQDIYQSAIGSDKSFSILIDSSIPDQATLSFDSTLTGQFSLRGELTIPLSGSVDESLAAINPNSLNEAYEINKRSAVFNLQTGEGEVINKSYTDSIAATNCQTAIDFVNALES